MTAMASQQVPDRKYWGIALLLLGSAMIHAISWTMPDHDKTMPLIGIFWCMFGAIRLLSLRQHVTAKLNNATADASQRSGSSTGGAT